MSYSVAVFCTNIRIETTGRAINHTVSDVKVGGMLEERENIT